MVACTRRPAGRLGPGSGRGELPHVGRRALGPPRIDLPIRLRFQQFLRGETWTLRRHGLRIVTIEPDITTLQAMGLNMMSARRIDKVEDHAYQHARRRLQAVPSTTRDRPTEPTA